MVVYCTVLLDYWDRISSSIYLNFIKDDRWKYLFTGLGTTLQIAFSQYSWES